MKALDSSSRCPAGEIEGCGDFRRNSVKSGYSITGYSNERYLKFNVIYLAKAASFDQVKNYLPLRYSV